MNELNCNNRTLFAHDNLDVLSDESTMPDECIDLIYLDPPFNSKSKYNLPFPKEYKQKIDLEPVMAFNDTWTWGNDCVQHLKRLKNGSFRDQQLADLITLTKRIRQEKNTSKDSMSAYLINMAVRLKAMQRVLKTTGSIYLHCDPTASHYLKLLMDTIFGRKNFRNECLWCYSGGGVPKSDFPRKHDVILRYTKSDRWTFNVLRKSYGTHAKSGRRATDLGGTRSVEYNPKGTPINNWWSDIKPLINWHKERLGYPTQKPLKLLKRIIEVSSNEGDLILDPFCGCGTTVHAAEELGRHWIGIDISQFSNGLVRNRLRNQFPRLSKSAIEIRGNPITVHDAIQLAKRDRYEFEKWVCGEIGAEGMYHSPGSRGADGGIDGIIPFYHTSSRKQRSADQAYAIVQVKSGKVTPDNVKALSTTVRQHKDHGFNSICGVFVCFDEYMRTVENNRDKTKVTDYFLNKSFDFIQPISVEGLLEGKLPYFPGGHRAKAA